MVKIAPSILSADFGHLVDDVRRVEAGGADALHVDVMDGHFVPNITLGPVVVASLCGQTSLPLDVHLMIEKPERYLADFVQAGAARLAVHAEACPHLHRAIQMIKALGVPAGVALNPATSLAALDYILPNLDFVLVMTVNPGFGGQALIPSVVPKIRSLKDLILARGLPTEITVDGGINAATAAAVAAAGADTLVAGSAVFGAADAAGAIAMLRDKAKPRA